MPEDSAFLSRKTLQRRIALNKSWNDKISAEKMRLFSSPEFFADHAEILSPLLFDFCSKKPDQDSAIALWGRVNELAFAAAHASIKYPTEDDL